MKNLIIFLLLFSILQVSACGNSANLTKSMDNSNEITLPKPIENFVKAVNDGDNEKFLAFFDPKEGVIDDWGRKFVGHEAIKGWSDKEFIGAKGKITPTKVEQNSNEISLWAGWKSNFYSGDSKFVFIVDGEKIKEMRIESAK